VALPWLSILDAAIGVANLARSRRAVAAPEAGLERSIDGGARALGGALGGIEARLAGVVVAALKEAFDRDTRRLELERQQLEAERARAERALKLELLRQAADREVGRLRLVAGMAVVAWIGTLFFSVRLLGGGMGPRILLGVGWALLLAAIGASFTAQSRIADALQREEPPTGPAGQASAWLVVGAMGLIALAVLIT
jgi:hypothetical protein